MTDNGKICYDDLQNFMNETVNTIGIQTNNHPFFDKYKLLQI